MTPRLTYFLLIDLPQLALIAFSLGMPLAVVGR